MIKDIIEYGEVEITYRNNQLLSEKPKLKNLFWKTTLRCNAICQHCESRASENLKLEDELTTNEIKNIIGYS